MERPSQGRKKDRQISLKEGRTPPKKAREAPRKKTGKQLRKARSTSLASSASTGESLSEEELVEEKKKLISTMRNKPWPMAKKLRELSPRGTNQERSDLPASHWKAQAFVEKYEGALGRGQGKHLYAYRMLMAKVLSVSFQKWIKFQRDFDNFKTQCIPWEMKIKDIESQYFSITVF
ncbi:Transmembrane channel-like protein 2 [Lemmus lemmus]